MVDTALTACELLEKDGLSLGLVNARFVKPLDTDMLFALAEQGKVLVTIEENVLAGGFGSAVLEALNDAGYCLPLLRIGLPDAFVAHGDTKHLRDDHGLSVEKIVARVTAFVKKD